MPVSFFALVTWTTLERRPMIEPRVAELLERFLPAEAERHGAQVVALGLVSDHVHILLRLPAAFDLPRLAQGFKGATSRIINQQVAASALGVRWARGYDARSISPRALPAAVAYVQGQATRHPDRAIAKIQRA